MLNKLLAVFAGVVTGFITISIVQYVGHLVYPLPSEVDPGNMESITAYMAEVPVGALLFVIVAYIVGSVDAGLVAGLVTRSAAIPVGIMCGVILMAAGIANLMTVPHPNWFYASLVVYVPSAVIGARMASRMKKSILEK